MNIMEEIKKFIKTANKPLIVILGPTASGKTSLSLALAHEINGEVISTDSRQIYKGMEIGTEAVFKKEMHGIPHHMIGITTPDKTITLAEYKEAAIKIINEIYKKKHIPMLVGGTGLYISAITEGYNVPRIPPNTDLRAKLSIQAEKKGKKSVHDLLARLDPEAAARIHQNNLRYVIRAIEVHKFSKDKKSEKLPATPFDTFMIGIDRPREELYAAIDARIGKQVKKGLIEEVKKLLVKKYDAALPAMSSLGVKEIIPYIKGNLTLPECLEILKKNTRNYAKRQMTWFRRYDNVRWLAPK
ncbi:MAG: tRNA (adenosine(37)-N6)-dimethylallyltransferase MiaA, partial [Candidatus Peregrinibacteria bacterium]